MKKLCFNDFQEESMMVDALCNVSGGCGTLWTFTSTHSFLRDRDSDSD